MSLDRKAPSDRPTEIRVKELRFSMPNGREIPIPGPHGGLVSQVNSITAGTRDGISWDITYVLWMRHHRVVYRNERNKTAKTFYVHETWCTFEAAE